MPFKFDGGYVVVHHPLVLPLIVVTVIQCRSAVLVAEHEGNLALYREDGGVTFLTVIPLVDDLFPQWEQYRRSPGG